MKPSLTKLHINPIEQYTLVSIKGKNSITTSEPVAIEQFTPSAIVQTGTVGTADPRLRSGKILVKAKSSGNPIR
jgi:hypothetical protein